MKSERPAHRGDVESVAYFYGVPLQATMVILENLHERGVLQAED
ncbi:hypothetical protein BH24ACT19_BH24ACT19_20880 [soil metagenome]